MKVPTVTQCFSALIASGNGQRCNSLKEKIHTHFMEVDEQTGQSKSTLFKFGSKQYPDLHKRLREEMGSIISSSLTNVDLSFFGSDLGDKNVHRKC